MFLTSEQLEEMTGYKSHQAQAEWLAANGYKFDLRRDGRPNVLLDQVRERQGCKLASGTDSTPGPDLSWMDEAV